MDETEKEIKMGADIRQSDVIQAHDSSRTSGNPTSGVSNKKAWIQRYADRMFTLWLERQTCLGVTRHYLEQLRQDLAKWYDEPLKKTFIEAAH